ncbi:MAG: FecR family protein, partial [Lachnospiraceae bacterium]|nr:FecR family protein [Lachnospiraceae bacterium]
MIRKSMAVVLAVGMILGLTACGDISDSGKSLSASASVSKTGSKAENITADRTIAVEEISGTVTASDDAETFNLVKGEHLNPGWEVATKEKSYLTLLLDSDKHVYAAELTRFELLAEGGLKSTRTVLSLMEGTLRSVIDNKLEPGESYEVTTPNASMAVRGTDFTVTVAQFNGAYVTTVKVDEGVVDVKANIGAEEITRELNPGDGLKIGDTGVKEFKEGSRRKLLKKTESNYAGGELMHYNIYTYSYDDNGFLLKEEIDSSAPFTTPSWYEYLNDADGNMIRKTLVYEGFGPDYYTEYEYDALGNM